MKRILVSALLLTAASFAAPAQAADDVDCAHYSAMNGSKRMAVIESMQSGMSSANKMSGSMASGAMSSSAHMSSKQMAKKVAAACKGHPGMMVGDAMKGAMAH